MDAPDAAPAEQKPTIVLIHGLWLTPLSWEGWKQRFESKGHTVLAPAWPGLEGTVEEVRQNTSRYERLGIKEITDHYDGIIRGLGAPPVIMGHSFGGLITQLLLHRARGVDARRLQDPEEDGRAHRAQGVPRPLPLHLLPGRLGRGGGLLARLGRAQRAGLTRRRCCKRSQAMPASPPPSTCPGRWTATSTLARSTTVRLV